MDDAIRDIDARLAGRIRELRKAHGLTLEALAERAGVSRSMISLVERGESSPTANVLDRLAAGLGVSLAALFADPAHPAAAPLVRRAEQRAWRDPQSGYVRRNLSPPSFPSPLELVEVVLPPGARVAYDAALRAAPLDQQIWVLEGELEFGLGETSWRLAAGDCLAVRVDQPTAFRNLAESPARYLVALTTGALGIQR